MSEPYWIALGSGGAVDYAGAWAAGTAYPSGSVVTYGGATYLAVNPSTGQTPPAVAPQQPGLVLIEDKLLSVNGAIDFQAIPATFKHLRLVASLRSTIAADFEPLSLRFNNDATAANYGGQHWYGVGATVSGAALSSSALIGQVNGAAATAGAWGSLTLDLIDYANASRHKTSLAVLGLLTGATVGIYNAAHRWASTAPIDRIALIVANQFAAGSRATLYGMA